MPNRKQSGGSGREFLEDQWGYPVVEILGYEKDGSPILSKSGTKTVTGTKSYEDEDFFEEEFLCKTKTQCLQDYGKEDIVREIRRRLTPDEIKDPVTGQETTFYKKLNMGKLTKKQLVDYLMKQNKRILQRLALQERDTTGKYKAAFPSKVTQPTMYDGRGMLKQEFLTEDHEGLTFYDDIEKKTYRVIVNPITRQATWEQVRDPQFANIIKGIRYRKDKLGRPDIKQLNYNEHHGRVVKDKNGKIHQVHCVKKNKSEPWEHPDNCKTDSRGNILLEYGPYDPDIQKGSKVSQTEFATPFGKFTYDQLMKMSLDKILQMLIVLELLDREGDYKKKMDELRARGVVLPGEEKYYQEYYPAEFAGRAAPGEQQMRTRFRKMRSTVKGGEAEFQESTFRAASLPRCRSPRDERCFKEIGSYYPGVCVRPAAEGKQSKCFKKNKKWIEAYNESDYASRLGKTVDDWDNMTLKEAEELLQRKQQIRRPMYRESREEIAQILDLAEQERLAIENIQKADSQAEYDAMIARKTQDYIERANARRVQVGLAAKQYTKADQQVVLSTIKAQFPYVGPTGDPRAQLIGAPEADDLVKGVASSRLSASNRALICPMHQTQSACVAAGCTFTAGATPPCSP